uniref:Phospholipase patatin family n=1 Tax=uncultured microorganism TaxID=358574 RepID=F8UI84_9ZZZZ|nr:phospholipase patatin family [uncultured microorganism]
MLGGCAAFDYRRGDAPQALARVPLVDPRPRIALVLGAGGPRGYAHIGVLRVLEEAGVEPDLVVGRQRRRADRRLLGQAGWTCRRDR